MLFINHSCSSTKQNMDISKGTILEIDFQDFFQRDKIGLNLRDCLILKDTLLTSNKTDGFTGLSVKVFSSNNEIVWVKYLNKEVECKINPQKIPITVFLNEKASCYEVDLSKGKFIGFSKRNETELYFNQATTSFVYD